jgi:hypothetical protein
VCGTSHGCAGRRADARHPPHKQRTRWQPAPLRAVRARPRPRRRRARRPRRVAAACPLPVVARMLSDEQLLSMAKNVQKNVGDVPRASPRIAWKSVRFAEKRQKRQQNVRIRGPKMLQTLSRAKTVKKVAGRPPWREQNNAKIFCYTHCKNIAQNAQHTV